MSTEFKDHFSTVSARYADFRPHYPAELFDYLATLAPANSTVWDCASGNGQATQALAKKFGKVIGTDASKQQIESAPRIQNAEFRVAPAEESGLGDESVDLITVAQALHWFDLKRFFAEANRVLRPRGVLAAWTYGINEVEGDEVNRIVREFYSNVVGPYWPPERKLVEEGYRSIQFPFTEVSVPNFRMEAEWSLDQLLGYFSTWSATQRYIKSRGEDPIVELRKQLMPLWDRQDRKITWPLALRVVRK
jgi:SAM-dependent methyltransferase